MWIIFLFSVFVLFASAVAVGVYYVLRRRSFPLAIGIGALGFILVILLFPIPIHGGVAPLGELLFHDLRKEIRSREAEGRKLANEAKLRALSERFRGALDSTTAVAQGALHDEKSGLLWIGPFDLASEELDLAKTYCQNIDPRGYWALPVEGEYFWYWRANGHDLRFVETGRYLSYNVVEPGYLELKTITVSREKTPQGHQPFAEPSTRIHCVARTANAPSQGYSNRDIPLNEWNEFQLTRSSPTTR